MVETEQGTLYVVSTPIGNLGDFSFRAVETLRSVSVVLAEDTRHVRQLLTHFDIRATVTAYHEHNEAQQVPRIVRKLQDGDNVALITDAGTPLLSDPGERLVAAAAAAGIQVNAVPGASALLAALVVSGLPASPFTFHGFLPRRGADRAELLQSIASNPHTVVVYEAANRLAATLADLAQVCGGDRRCSVSRELTKLFEETRRGTLADSAEYYKLTPARGEVVLLIAGATPSEYGEEHWRELAKGLSLRGLSTKDIVSIMVKEHGAPRNLAYRLAREG